MTEQGSVVEGTGQQLLTNSRGIRIVELSRDHLRDAAQLRAAANIRTPDALQLAAAARYGCTAFVTNDRRLPAVRGTRVLQLADYAA
jgi:predicted nucleic acid-binding protein